MSYHVMKRFLDFTFSILLIFLLFPLFVATTLSIFLLNGRPIFFVQVRPGFQGQPFKIYKFRTMSNRVDQHESPGSLRRVTPLGRYLRLTSIDEIPQLWNILRGDMSFVGPRPLLFDYLDVYTTEEKERHAVRPGLTGLAQIGGRKEVLWEEKIALDLTYVRSTSFLTDLKIVLRSFIIVWSKFDSVETRSKSRP